MSAVERAHSLVGGSPPDPVRERLGTIEAWAKDVERRASGGHGWDTVTSRDGRDSDTEGDPGGDGEEGTTSLADMKRALRQNFINTGVIEDVTVRRRMQLSTSFCHRITWRGPYWILVNLLLRQDLELIMQYRYSNPVLL